MLYSSLSTRKPESPDHRHGTLSALSVLLSPLLYAQILRLHPGVIIHSAYVMGAFPVLMKLFTCIKCNISVQLNVSATCLGNVRVHTVYCLMLSRMQCSILRKNHSTALVGAITWDLHQTVMRVFSARTASLSIYRHFKQRIKKRHQRNINRYIA